MLIKGTSVDVWTGGVNEPKRRWRKLSRRDS